LSPLNIFLHVSVSYLLPVLSLVILPHAWKPKIHIQYRNQTQSMCRFRSMQPICIHGIPSVSVLDMQYSTLPSVISVHHL
jgi:hypothetical protein